MSPNRLDWDLARSFLAVMRDGSLSAAARRLNTAQATVRRHVEGLEAALGVALFLRTTTGLAPTEAAQAALPHAEALEAGLAAMARAVLVTSEIAGSVRVTCSDVIGNTVAPAILAPLLAQHPGLSVELAPSNRVQDLMRRDADIAIRMVRPRQSALVARKIGTLALGLFATHGYLVGRPAIDNIADLGRHILIGGDRDDSANLALIAAGAVAPHFAFRTDSDIAQLAAIRAGAGIGICQVALARREPALIPVLPQHRQSLDLWLAVHGDLRGVPRVSAVFDHLASGLGNYVREGMV